MSSSLIQQAIAYQFELQYDANTLTYTGYTTQGTIAETGTIEVNSTKDTGILYVSFMTAEPFSVNNSLIKLNFKVVNNYHNNQTTAYFNQCFIDNQEIYNYDPGTIYIDYMMKGDVDANFMVQAYDAALTLQYSVGKDPLPQLDPLPWDNWRLQAANVDGVQGIHLRRQVFERAAVVDHVVGRRQASFPAGLRCRDALDLGSRQAATRHDARDAQFVIAIDHGHPLDALAIVARFDQQRYFHHHIGRAGRQRLAATPLCLGTDHGVQNGFQALARARIAEASIQRGSSAHRNIPPRGVFQRTPSGIWRLSAASIAAHWSR